MQTNSEYMQETAIGFRLAKNTLLKNKIGNNFTGGNNSQSNFRFQTGAQFRF